MLSETEKRVFEYIESHRDDMIRYLRRLVSIDTQTPPGHNYDAICDLMSNRFSELGCETRVHEATEKYMSSSAWRGLAATSWPSTGVGEAAPRFT
jgi:acetylornithine deacetylase/succinyl-diaminopimelate desuccinylase-like protein